MWKKMLLVAMLFIAVGSFELSAQESATPTVVDQIVRKLGRGISNVAFGVWTPGLFTVPGAGASQSSCLGAH